MSFVTINDHVIDQRIWWHGIFSLNETSNPNRLLKHMLVSKRQAHARSEFTTHVSIIFWCANNRFKFKNQNWNTSSLSTWKSLLRSFSTLLLPVHTHQDGVTQIFISILSWLHPSLHLTQATQGNERHLCERGLVVRLSNGIVTSRSGEMLESKFESGKNSTILW